MTRMTIREGTACKNSGKGRALYDPHNQLCESRAEIGAGGGGDAQCITRMPNTARVGTQVVGGRTCRVCMDNGVGGTHQ